MANRSSKLVAPISILEFSNALFSIWKRASNHGGKTNTLGLAISGGVDSMALAALCSKLTHKKQATPGSEFAFKAFVVDHGVREGSDTEAKSVSKVLEARGIPTKVLKLDWGTLSSPGKSPNFESLARIYRFQALGRACRDHDINSLFLAHHEDDQVETVMMRLINQHNSLGLAGIRSFSPIPECEGIYGVHQSGGPISPTEIVTSSSDQLLVERGGISVYRPLLRFGKARLIATCHEEKMEWFEDATNRDPKVTVRNAIRHIFRRHELPVALRTESLAGLSRRLQEKRDATEVATDEIFKQNVKIELNNRAGTIKLRFPDLDQIKLPPIAQENRGMVTALLVRRILTLVSPTPNIPLQSLHSTVDRLFPELQTPATEDQSWSGNKALTGFTVAGVRFQALPSEQPQKPIYLLSRQPYASSEPRPILIISPSSTWTSWTLFDNRFWLRFQNEHKRDVVVRPLQKEDLAYLKPAVGRDMWKRVERLLRNVAPGDVRWTLPAVVREGKVVALPTLDVCVPGEKGVKWEARWKMVDL